MATSKTANYTTAQVEQIVSMYADLGNEGLQDISDAVGKSVRSVRSKLVREGVYVATPKAAAPKRDQGPTKKELLNQLEGLDPQMPVNGLTGATKEAIEYLIAKVA